MVLIWILIKPTKYKTTTTNHLQHVRIKWVVKLTEYLILRI